MRSAGRRQLGTTQAAAIGLEGKQTRMPGSATILEQASMARVS